MSTASKTIYVSAFFALVVGLVGGLLTGSQLFPKTETRTPFQTETMTSVSTLTSQTTVTAILTETFTKSVTTTQTVFETTTETRTPTVWITSTTTWTHTPPPRQVKILSNITIGYPAGALYSGSLPAVEVRGEVQNVGSTCVEFVKVIATFYDEQGRVLGSEFTYADPHRLEPGQKAPFEILWTDILAPLHEHNTLTLDFRDCI